MTIHSTQVAYETKQITKKNKQTIFGVIKSVKHNLPCFL